MDNQIQRSLKAAISQYAQQSGADGGGLADGLPQVYAAETPFMDKVARMDALVDDFPRFEELREVLFDLLLMNFFTDDVKKLEEDYLESEEWEAIEEETIDRGTELLNMLLYITECQDEGLEPEIGDYLKEFLLVDEDEFQDEYRIYEPMIANQLLVESDFRAIAHAASAVDEDSEVSAIFYPVLSFFSEPHFTEATFHTYIQAAPNKPMDAAVYALLTSFNA